MYRISVFLLALFFYSVFGQQCEIPCECIGAGVCCSAGFSCDCETLSCTPTTGEDDNKSETTTYVLAGLGVFALGAIILIIGVVLEQKGLIDCGKTVMQRSGYTQA